jgi:Zn-dependent alcohol dehydrogenase
MISVKYPITFKAAILEKINSPLLLQDVTFDGPLDFGQVLVKLIASGICGKQIEEIQGIQGKDPYLPHMLGHEGVGIVVDVGPGVTMVQKGDHVIVTWIIGNGLDAKKPEYHIKNKKINAGPVTTFNEYCVVPENRVTAFKSDIRNIAYLSILGCAVMTGIGVVINEAKVVPGATVAVVGCGGVGLNVIQGAVIAQSTKIYAIDKNNKSLQIAAHLGATDIIDSSIDDIYLKMMELTDGEGTDYVFICAPSPKLIEIGAKICSIPGFLYVVAVPPPNTTISIDPLAIHRKMSLNGSCGGGSLPARDIPLLIEHINNGKLDLNSIITKIISLEDINEGIYSIMNGHPGRCIIIFR